MALCGSLCLRGPRTIPEMGHLSERFAGLSMWSYSLLKLIPGSRSTARLQGPGPRVWRCCESRYLRGSLPRGHAGHTSTATCAVCLPGTPTRSDPHRRGLGSDSRRCLSLAPGHLPDSQKEGRCVLSINYIACTASLGTRIYSQLLGTEVSRKNSFTEQG